jgi:hypothetical protein
LISKTLLLVSIDKEKRAWSKCLALLHSTAWLGGRANGQNDYSANQVKLPKKLSRQSIRRENHFNWG